MNNIGEISRDQQPNGTQWDTLEKEVPFAGNKGNVDANNSEEEKSALEKLQERKDQYILDKTKLMEQKYSEGARMTGEGGNLSDLEKAYDKKMMDLQTQYLREQGKVLIDDKEMQTAWNIICAPKEDEETYHPSRQSMERAVDSMMDLEEGMSVKKVAARYDGRIGISTTDDLAESGLIDFTHISHLDGLGASLVATFSRRGQEFAELTGAKSLASSK